nr:hypothetical protein OJOKFFHK_00020 [uncultured bacterium]
MNKATVLAGIGFACALQLSTGALWLGQFVGFNNAFAMGVLPFVAGEALKALAVAGYLARNAKTA